MSLYDTNTPGTDIHTAYNFYTPSGTVDMNKFNTWASNPDNATAAADLGAKGLSFNTTSGIGTFKGVDPKVTPTNWGMSGWGGLGLGLGQLGLGLASYLNSSKTADAQRRLMAQQAKQNTYNYNKTIADNKHIQQIFNPNNQ